MPIRGNFYYIILENTAKTKNFKPIIEKKSLNETNHNTVMYESISVNRSTFPIYEHTMTSPGERERRHFPFIRYTPCPFVYGVTLIQPNISQFRVI